MFSQIDSLFHLNQNIINNNHIYHTAQNTNIKENTFSINNANTNHDTQNFGWNHEFLDNGNENVYNNTFSNNNANIKANDFYFQYGNDFVDACKNTITENDNNTNYIYQNDIDPLQYQVTNPDLDDSTVDSLQSSVDSIQLDDSRFDDDYSNKSNSSGQADEVVIPKGTFLEQNELISYTLIEQIGNGAFAKVFKAVPSASGPKSFLLQRFPKVAIKVIRKENVRLNDNYCPQCAKIHRHKHRHHKVKKLKTTTRDEVMTELTIQRTVSGISDHIVNFVDFEETESFYFIVLEYVDGGEVFDQVVKYTYFSEDLTRHIIHQLALAVKHLHSVGVVHRDIKLENILFERNGLPEMKQMGSDPHSLSSKTKLDEGVFIKNHGAAGIGKIKLTDFGLSKQIFHDNTTTPCGTLGYTAPEVISQSKYSNKVDLWGIGCVLYTLLCGFPPFYDEDSNMLRRNICEGNYQFLSPWWDNISSEAKLLVTKLLDVNPQRRYDVDDLLNDPWLNNYDCDKHQTQNNSIPASVSLSIKPQTLTENDTLEVIEVRTITNTPSISIKQNKQNRAALLHNAFDQSNSIQRNRADKENYILKTGFIVSPSDQLSRFIKQERYDNNRFHFNLNLANSTIVRRRSNT